MSDLKVYDIGDQVRMQKPAADAYLFGVNGVATDPTTVTFKITKPDGTTTTYVYGTDAALVKDSTGNYHVDFTTTMRGMHYYRFAGTGACQAASEGQFLVGPSSAS